MQLNDLVVGSLAAERSDVFTHYGRSKEISQTAGANAEKALLNIVFTKSLGHDSVEIDGFIDCLDTTSGFETY